MIIVATCLVFALAALLVGILAGALAFWSLALAVAAGLAGRRDVTADWLMRLHAQLAAAKRKRRAA
jgi:hypothetical protein